MNLNIKENDNNNLTIHERSILNQIIRNCNVS